MISRLTSPKSFASWTPSMPMTYSGISDQELGWNRALPWTYPWMKLERKFWVDGLKQEWVRIQFTWFLEVTFLFRSSVHMWQPWGKAVHLWLWGNLSSVAMEAHGYLIYHSVHWLELQQYLIINDISDQYFHLFECRKQNYQSIHS